MNGSWFKPIDEALIAYLMTKIINEGLGGDHISFHWFLTYDL